MHKEKASYKPVTLTEKILKGSFVVVLFTSFTSPLGYLIKMIYSRTLSIEMFGLFYAVLAFFLLISSYKSLGFNFSLTYFVPKYLRKKDYKTCWNLFKYDQIIEVGTSLIMSGILYISADWLTIHYFKTQEAKQLIYIFIIYLVSSGFLSAIEKFFIGLQQEKFYSSINTVKLFFTLTFSLIIWLLKDPKVIDYAVIWSIASLIAAIIYYLLLIKRYKYLIHQVEWNEKLFKLMFKFALPSFLTAFVSTLVTSTNNIFLTMFKDVKEVGVYNIVLPLASVSTIVLTPVNTFLFPLVSDFMDVDKKRVQKLLHMALTIIPFIGFYFALFIAVFPTQPIHFLFGEKWILSARLPLVILSIGYIFVITSNFLSTVVTGMGKVNEYLRASVITAVVNIIITYMLVIRYSVLGIVIASSIVYIMSLVLYTGIIKKSISFKFPIFFYIKLLVLGGVTYFLAKYLDLDPTGLMQYIGYGLIYTLIIAGLAYYLRVFDINMLKLLVKIK